jgi:hypothetical protein
MTPFQDFLEAIRAVSFFIRIAVPKSFQQEISLNLNNNKTNEKLVVKAEAGLAGLRRYEQRLLISRHPSTAAKHKLEEDEKGIFEWDHFAEANKRICFRM